MNEFETQKRLVRISWIMTTFPFSAAVNGVPFATAVRKEAPAEETLGLLADLLDSLSTHATQFAERARRDEEKLRILNSDVAAMRRVLGTESKR